MSPSIPADKNRRSLIPTVIPSLIPMRAFTDDEDAAFGEMDDDAELDALVDVLFPET